MIGTGRLRLVAFLPALIASQRAFLLGGGGGDGFGEM